MLSFKYLKKTYVYDQHLAYDRLWHPKANERMELNDDLRQIEAKQKARVIGRL